MGSEGLEGALKGLWVRNGPCRGGSVGCEGPWGAVGQEQGDVEYEGAVGQERALMGRECGM